MREISGRLRRSRNRPQRYAGGPQPLRFIAEKAEQLIPDDRISQSSAIDVISRGVERIRCSIGHCVESRYTPQPEKVPVVFVGSRFRGDADRPPGAVPNARIHSIFLDIAFLYGIG